MAVNPKPSLMKPKDWSPNQVAKRDRIVQAASRLMVRDGIHACTARTISAECGFSTSSIHYYFRDIDEILDLAIRRVIDRFLGEVQQAAAEYDDPIRALWAATYAYIERTSDSARAADEFGTRHAPMVWFEYQARSLRIGDISTAKELAARGAAYFVELVTHCDVEEAALKADSLYCALLGAGLRDSMARRPTSEWVREILLAHGLPIPEAESLRASKPKRAKKSAAG